MSLYLGEGLSPSHVVSSRVLQTGSILGGRYRIEAVLGSGGMGEVYRAVNITTNQRVAIKAMSVDTVKPAQRPLAQKQFRREASILATLSHPGIAPMLDLLEDGDACYLIEQLVVGTTLESVVEKSPGTLDVETVLEWMLQICDVLEYLHGHTPPVLFRDLKPSNIMLDRNGRISLIDFGISRFNPPQSATSNYLKGSGTAGFCPLEQCVVGGHTDTRSDIYALGATMYRLLTAITPALSLVLLMGEELDAPRDLNPRIPESVNAAILKMMALLKEDRFQSIAEVREALLACSSRSSGG